MKRRDFIALIGGAAGLSGVPLVAGAEEPATRVLGFMSARSPEDSARELIAFRKGLGQNGQNGLTERRKLKVEYRCARGDYSRAAGDWPPNWFIESDGPENPIAPFTSLAQSFGSQPLGPRRFCQGEQIPCRQGI